MGRDSERTVIAVDRQGSLYGLLREFLDAYKARTTVLANQGGGDNNKLDAIIEMLRSGASVPAELQLVKEELSIIHGLLTDGSDVLTAINNLDRKVDEFMATQEERLKNVQSALTSIASGVDTLQQQVADLKVNNPDLEEEIGGIEATVKGIADDINGVVPETGGGETGGGTEGGSEGGGSR